MFSYTERLTSIKISVSNWIIKRKAHLITWTAFILYEVIIIGLRAPHFSKFSNYVIHYGLNICFFYFHAHFTLTKATENKKQAYWRLPIYIFLEIMLYILVIYTVDNIICKYTDIVGGDTVTFGQMYFTQIIFRGIYFAAFATGYYFLITFLKEKRRADKLERVKLNNLIKTEYVEKELVKAQNAYLRAQINPHFLFNTLDFIYHDTRKTAPLSAEMITILADIMRYASDHNFTGDFSTLGEEIDQVANLIQLHQIKKDYGLYIDFNYKNEIRELKFIPLILSTLIENMMKHGELEKEDSPASISLRVEDGMLSIKTSNLVHEHHNARGLSSGVKNMVERLNYTYGDQCEFNTHIDDRNNYHTSILLKLS